MSKTGKMADPSFHQDEVIHDRIFAPKRGGYNPSLNQYRVTYRNLNLADENGMASPLPSLSLKIRVIINQCIR